MSNLSRELDVDFVLELDEPAILANAGVSEEEVRAYVVDNGHMPFQVAVDGAAAHKQALEMKPEAAE